MGCARKYVALFNHPGGAHLPAHAEPIGVYGMHRLGRRPQPAQPVASAVRSVGKAESLRCRRQASPLFNGAPRGRLWRRACTSNCCLLDSSKECKLRRLCGPAVRVIWGLGMVAVFAHGLIDYPFQQRPALAAFFFAWLGVVMATGEAQCNWRPQGPPGVLGCAGCPDHTSAGDACLPSNLSVLDFLPGFESFQDPLRRWFIS